MAFNFGFDYRDIRKNEEVLNTVPFSSDRKRMSAICRLKKSGKYYIFCKGAPEIVLKYCSKYLDKSNEATPINERFRAEL
jgi:P-type E1-E2 ATPase